MPLIVFFFFCHGGIDPIINLKYFFQKIVQDHKKSGNTDTTSLHFSHADRENSGLLWTDFRANRYTDEPPCRTSSPRGPQIHLFNASAILEFFSEHVSQHPRHPYILDAMIRGHQHLFGIGRLKDESPSEEHDWQMLSSGTTERIKPGSLYTCTSSTRWLPSAMYEVEADAEIAFDKDSRTWQLTSNSLYRLPKTDT